MAYRPSWLVVHILSRRLPGNSNTNTSGTRGRCSLLSPFWQLCWHFFCLKERSVFHDENPVSCRVSCGNDGPGGFSGACPLRQKGGRGSMIALPRVVPGRGPFEACGQVWAVTQAELAMQWRRWGLWVAFSVTTGLLLLLTVQTALYFHHLPPTSLYVRLHFTAEGFNNSII